MRPRAGEAEQGDGDHHSERGQADDYIAEDETGSRQLDPGHATVADLRHGEVPADHRGDRCRGEKDSAQTEDEGDY